MICYYVTVVSVVVVVGHVRQTNHNVIRKDKNKRLQQCEFCSCFIVAVVVLVFEFFVGVLAPDDFIAVPVIDVFVVLAVLLLVVISGRGGGGGRRCHPSPAGHTFVFQATICLQLMVSFVENLPSLS